MTIRYVDIERTNEIPFKRICLHAIVEAMSNIAKYVEYQEVEKKDENNKSKRKQNKSLYGQEEL